MSKNYKRKQNKLDPTLVKSEIIIYINVNYNNIIITITNSTGHVIDWFSSGSLGLKGFRKTSALAAKLLALHLFERTKNFANKNFRIKVKGFNAIRKALLKYISMQNFNVLELKELSNVPFNGCKPRKRRKL